MSSASPLAILVYCCVNRLYCGVNSATENVRVCCPVSACDVLTGISIFVKAKNYVCFLRKSAPSMVFVQSDLHLHVNVFRCAKVLSLPSSSPHFDHFLTDIFISSKSDMPESIDIPTPVKTAILFASLRSLMACPIL
jgi:hypothetical protein